MLALERGGADLIELGVPFSDPVADGPVIQAGMETRAQGRHDAAQACSRSRREIRRKSEVPLLLFSYLNPILRYGLEALARDAARRRHRRLPDHGPQRGRGARLRRT